MMGSSTLTKASAEHRREPHHDHFVRPRRIPAFADIHVAAVRAIAGSDQISVTGFTLLPPSGSPRCALIRRCADAAPLICVATQIDNGFNIRFIESPRVKRREPHPFHRAHLVRLIHEPFGRKPIRTTGLPSSL